ncbi:MAG: hypothetical protein WEE89_11410 [Gemmatimonadota bacterium]
MSTLDHGFGMEGAPQSIPTGVISALARTHPWARLLAIFGFVVVALMLLAGLAGGIMGVASGSAETAAAMIIYPLLSLLYFFPSLYLLRFANRTRDFVSQADPRLLEAALESQRVLYKFVAIYVIVCMVLIIVMGIAIAAMGVAAGGALRSLSRGLSHRFRYHAKLVGQAM